VGRIATIIAVSYGILGGIVVLALAIVIWSSTRARNRNTNLHKLAEREKTWFGIVVVMLVALLFATIWFTPYGKSAGSGGQPFAVKAEQFAFLVPSTRLKAGKPVRFHLTSADVNHGFAVFNSKNVLLFQIQVVPGATEEYVYTFKDPGTYHILCFEYCGVGHDQMKGTFTVTG
jgi:cytochrome c oxidase subunit 2